MEFVIAKLVQIPRFNGMYDKDTIKNGKVLKEEHPVTRAYAEKTNDSFALCGKYYVINESKSKAYADKLKNSIQSRNEKDAANTLAGSDLVNTLINKGLSALGKEGNNATK